MVISKHLSKLVPVLLCVCAQHSGCTYVSEETDGFPSVHMQQFKAALRVYTLGTPTTQSELEEEFGDREYPRVPSASGLLNDGARVEERTFGDFKVIDLVPRHDPSDLRILYLHGGGYVFELSAPHLLMLEALLEQTGATITIPVYPLAPEFTHADAFPFIEEVYRELLEQGPASTIVMGGDSAGGGLALAQISRYRELGLDLPRQLFLFSPWLDVTMSHPDIPALEGTECVLVTKALRVYGQWWAGDEDPSEPSFSPLFGDLSALPPVVVFGGTDELLLPDLRDFADKLGAERVFVRNGNARAKTNSRHLYFEYAGAMHAFPLLELAPEADDAIARVAAFIKE